MVYTLSEGLTSPILASALHFPKMDMDIKPLHHDDLLAICNTAVDYFKAGPDYGAFNVIQFLTRPKAVINLTAGAMTSVVQMHPQSCLTCLRT